MLHKTAHTEEGEKHKDHKEHLTPELPSLYSLYILRSHQEGNLIMLEISWPFNKT